MGQKLNTSITSSSRIAISLKNNRLININVECKTCSSETYNYELDNHELQISPDGFDDHYKTFCGT